MHTCEISCWGLSTSSNMGSPCPGGASSLGPAWGQPGTGHLGWARGPILTPIYLALRCPWGLLENHPDKTQIPLSTHPTPAAMAPHSPGWPRAREGPRTLGVGQPPCCRLGGSAHLRASCWSTGVASRLPGQERHPGGGSLRLSRGGVAPEASGRGGQRPSMPQSSSLGAQPTPTPSSGTPGLPCSGGAAVLPQWSAGKLAPPPMPRSSEH